MGTHKSHEKYYDQFKLMLPVENKEIETTLDWSNSFLKKQYGTRMRSLFEIFLKPYEDRKWRTKSLNVIFGLKSTKSFEKTHFTSDTIFSKSIDTTISWLSSGIKKIKVVNMVNPRYFDDSKSLALIYSNILLFR